MSASLKTEHYNIPKYSPEDTFNPLTGENIGADIIDAELYANKQAADTNATNIRGLQAEDTHIKGIIGGVSDRVATIEAKVPGYDNVVSGEGALSEQVNSNKEAIEGLDVRTTNLETNVQHLQQEDDALDERVTAAENAIAALPDVSGMQSEIDGIKVDNAAQVFKTSNVLYDNGNLFFGSAIIEEPTRALRNVRGDAPYTKILYNNSIVIIPPIYFDCSNFDNQVRCIGFYISGNPFALSAGISTNLMTIAACVVTRSSGTGIDVFSSVYSGTYTAKYYEDTNRTKLWAAMGSLITIGSVGDNTDSVILGVSYNIPQLKEG